MSIGALEEFGIRQETVNAFSFYEYFLRLICVLSLRMENNLCKKKSLPKLVVYSLFALKYLHRLLPFAIVLQSLLR
jgi:hypothetical protein